MNLLALMIALFVAGATLPNELANYRDWPQLLNVPYQVPLELYIRCTMPTPKDWNEAQKKYGPHSQKYVRVYGNPVAVNALTARRPLPVGSMIVKEKFVDTPHGAPDGVAFMVKRGTPELADSGGWQFLYFPSPPDPKASHRACASCHQAAKATDYVFGTYPR